MFASYNVLLILAILSFLYYIFFLLVDYQKISLISHRKFWNWLLAITFLVSGLIGLILAFLIDYKMNISWYSKLLWYHVEFGIAMSVIAIFHLFWHLRYYFPKKQNML